MKLECLPAEFFRELARQFPEDAAFTLIYQGQASWASCAVSRTGTTTTIFSAVSTMNSTKRRTCTSISCMKTSIMRCAGTRIIHVGQTANEFKLRVGCHLEPRYFYVKALGPGLQSLVRAGSPYLFPPCAAD